METDILLKISLNETITEFQKRILMIVYIDEASEGYCPLRVDEIAEKGNIPIKDAVYSYAGLLKSGYLEKGKTAASKTTLGHNLINYNLFSIKSYKRNNYNNNYNKVILNPDEISEIAQSISDVHVDKNLESISKCIRDIVTFSLFQKHFSVNEVLNAILLHLKTQEKLGKLKTIDIQKEEIPGSSELREVVTNALRFISGNPEVTEDSKISAERASQKVKKQLHDKYITKGRKETCQDITDDPTKLQQIPSREFRLVTITGVVVRVYTAGSPPICNITLETASGDSIFAKVLDTHYRSLQLILDGYKGDISVQGKVVSSKYHLNKFGVSNIIESISHLDPVIFKDPPPSHDQVDTYLDDSPF